MEEVAPLMGWPALFHWYVGGGAPLTVTEKVTVVPGDAIWACGWIRICGAAGSCPLRMVSLLVSAT